MGGPLLLWCQRNKTIMFINVHHNFLTFGRHVAPWPKPGQKGRKGRKGRKGPPERDHFRPDRTGRSGRGRGNFTCLVRDSWSSVVLSYVMYTVNYWALPWLIIPGGHETQRLFLGRLKNWNTFHYSVHGVCLNSRLEWNDLCYWGVDYVFSSIF